MLIVPSYLQAGAEVDAVNHTQLTPLTTALTNHSSNALERLIQVGMLAFS